MFLKVKLDTRVRLEFATVILHNDVYNVENHEKVSRLKLSMEVH